MADLDEEYEYFKRRLDDLLQQCSGKYAVVKGQEVKETLDTHADAWKWTRAKGYEPETFIIQEITDGHNSVVMNAA